MPLIPELGGRVRRISEFKANLVLKISSRTVRAVILRNTVSINRKNVACQCTVDLSSPGEFMVDTSGPSEQQKS